MKKTIGLLGGMGPEATVYFFGLIIKNTAAARDQDHIPVIIYNRPQIPERTAAVLGKGPSPVPLLREGIRRLARAGADFVVIPCITAHAFLPDIKAAARIPILSLVDEAVSFISRVRNLPVAEKATLQSGLTYQGAVRMRLDVSQLPKPFQITALGSREWNLNSDWFRFPVTP